MSYRLDNVCLEIDGHHILKEINITFYEGEIHAIIGGNGAGKSSLMKVMTGLYQPVSGTIEGDHDIAFVAQEVDEALFPDLSVYDNLALKDLTRGVLYHRKRQQVIQKMLSDWGAAFNANTLVKDLNIAEKQQLLIMRAVLADSDFIILDEPTASLSSKEVAQLFVILRALKEKGKGIIFISHRIHELLTIADHITVLKTGEIIGSKIRNKWSETEILSYLTNDVHVKSNRTPGEVLYEMKSAPFKLRRNEVLGIAGLLGAGKTRIANKIFKDTGGAYIPEERRKHGLVTEASIVDNVNFHTGGFWIYPQKEKRFVESTKDRLNLKYNHPNQSVRTLSGGNQQKVVLMKWFDTQRDIYIFDEPTVGIDAGAKQDLFREVNHLADQGKAVVYLSSDFNELLNVSDYIHVLYQGEVVSDGPVCHYTESQLLSYASGGTGDEV